MQSEAMLWIGVILASPAIVMLVKIFTVWFLGFFISDDVIEITIEREDGELITRKIDLDSDDELIKILDEIADCSSNQNGASL